MVRTVSKNKQTRKQIASSIALERRKTKRRLSGAGETEITDEMVGEKLATSCADRIHGMLPKPKAKRPMAQQFEKKNPRPWTSIPTKPMKRNVLWMTMKEQDSSSTMSLSDEIRSFADYVSVRHIDNNHKCTCGNLCDMLLDCRSGCAVLLSSYVR
jgi:hypothetical protein